MEWLAVGVAVIIQIVGLAYGYGKLNGRLKAVEDKHQGDMAKIEKDEERRDGYHKLHFKHADDDQVHFQDTELHWTSRERDALGHTLERMEKSLEELLKRKQ